MRARMDEPAICRGPSRCSAHPRGVEGPVVAPGTDGARREMDAPEPAVTPAQHNLLGQSCCQSPLWEPGPGRGSSEPAQARACQPQRVPDPRSWAGRQDPGARTCRATKPPGSPHPAAFGGLSRDSPTPRGFSRSARAEVGSPLSSHDRAGAQPNKAHAQMCPRGPARAHAQARPPGPCAPRRASSGA